MLGGPGDQQRERSYASAREGFEPDAEANEWLWQLQLGRTDSPAPNHTHHSDHHIRGNLGIDPLALRSAQAPRMRDTSFKRASVGTRPKPTTKWQRQWLWPMYIVQTRIDQASDQPDTLPSLPLFRPPSRSVLGVTVPARGIRRAQGPAGDVRSCRRSRPDRSTITLSYPNRVDASGWSAVGLFTRPGILSRLTPPGLIGIPSRTRAPRIRPC